MRRFAITFILSLIGSFSMARAGLQPLETSIYIGIATACTMVSLHRVCVAMFANEGNMK